MGHLGFSRTIGSVGPLPTASVPILLQRSLAVEAGLFQWGPVILPLNKGRGVSFELSHSTLIHSLPLKLCSRVFIGFLLKFDFKKSLSLISLLQEKKEQLIGKNVHFDFTNVTCFELYVFVLLHHERLRAEGLRRIQEDGGWKFTPFSGWLKLVHSRTYAYTKHDGQ